MPYGIVHAGPLADLAERIAQIEGRAGRARPVVAAAAARIASPIGSSIAARTASPIAPSIAPDPHRVRTGWDAIDDALAGGLPRQGLHEWCGVDLVGVLVHLAWQALLHDDAHHPGAMRRIVWIGAGVHPAPHAMVRGLRAPLLGMFGAPAPRVWPDARLWERSILVDPPSDGVRLWAIEQAARCPGVCAVVADVGGFDFAATRRLQLAAHEVLLLGARAPRRAMPLSACSTRWRVEPVPAGLARAEFQARADAVAAGAAVARTTAADAVAAGETLRARLPAEPHWQVRLERAKGLGASLDPERLPQVLAARHWELDASALVPRLAAATAARRAAVRTARLARRQLPRTAEAGEAGARTRDRNRGRDRCTSGGERWATRLDDQAA
ncbi:MAG: hypothetical protein U0625_08905 [Phycisphaerales bacterium]